MHMVHRGIATLAGALMLSFLWLGILEPQFVLLHFYQSLIYLAIILMLFYLEDRYAYMLGIIAPAVWLLMNYATGMLGAGFRQVHRLVHAEMPSNQVSLWAAITAALSLLMIGFCAYRWKREFSGLHKGTVTFIVSFVIVIVYYGILVAWFWNLVPQS
jgi:hypothetical protein